LRTIGLSGDERVALTLLKGSALRGALHLTSGLEIPAPRAAHFWLVEDEGKRREVTAHALNHPVEECGKANQARLEVVVFWVCGVSVSSHTVL
jgi:hypothetical protein